MNTLYLLLCEELMKIPNLNKATVTINGDAIDLYYDDIKIGYVYTDSYNYAFKDYTSIYDLDHLLHIPMEMVDCIISRLNDLRMQRRLIIPWYITKRRIRG